MKQKLLYIIITIAALAWSGEGRGQTAQYVLTHENEESITTQIYSFTGVNSESYQLSGVGYQVFFQAKKNKKAAASGFFVQGCSTNSNKNSDWTNFNSNELDLTTDYKQFTESISGDNINYIRFRAEVGATYTKYFRKVYVSRKTTLSFSSSNYTTQSSSITFVKGTPSQSKTISYNNTITPRNVTITKSGNNPGDFSIDAINNLGANGNVSPNITFTPTAKGSRSATITLNLPSISVTDNNKGITVTSNAQTATITVSGTGYQYYTKAEVSASAGGNAYTSFSSYAAATNVFDRKDEINGLASASATAYFKAQNSTGYNFKGWTAANVSYENGYLPGKGETFNEPYSYDSEDENNPTLKQYKAWFAPVASFTCSARVGSVAGGTASVNWTNKTNVEGTPGETSVSTSATFTANPSLGYEFVEWRTDPNNASTKVSESASYEKPLTTAAGSTLPTTLYAIFREKTLTLNPTSPNYTADYYKQVSLGRTLPQGYSTLALPFDTDVETLVVGRSEAYDSDEDWVAQLDIVTYNAQDGYTLYFQKVDGGTITANQPYVLHLGTQVVNPTWTDLTNGISVEAAEATSVGASTGYSGYAGWNMCSNFAFNFPMAGKYGIVNSKGGLMLGSGEDAKLNAFTAYITGPTSGPNGAPQLRVAYVDEDGTATFIGSLPEDDLQGEPVAIYGPDGQRRSKMQRGVNIVRYADGTTRKINY